jgi:hypothetical protein
MVIIILPYPMSRFICEHCNFCSPTRGRLTKHLLTQKHLLNARATEPVHNSFVETSIYDGCNISIEVESDDAAVGDLDQSDDAAVGDLDQSDDAAVGDLDQSDDASVGDLDQSDGYNDLHEYFGNIDQAEFCFAVHELLQQKNVQTAVYIDYVKSVHQNLLFLLPILAASIGFYIGRHW